MTRTLVLLRHGQTEWNASGRAQGHADVHLDETGRLQAELAATALAAVRPTLVRSSDLARARETAEAVADACGLAVVLDARLREFDVGVRSGLTPSEFADRFPDEYAALAAGHDGPRVPGEESDDQVASRMTAALRDAWESLGPDETGVVVSHGASLKVGIGAMLGWPPAAAFGLVGMDNCGAAALVGGDRGPRLAAYNVSFHGTGDAATPDFTKRASAR